MRPLTARDALSDNVLRVRAHGRPTELRGQAGHGTLFAVFDEAPDGEDVGPFLGLVIRHAAGFSDRIFADLVSEPSPSLPADLPLEEVVRRMESEGHEALAVVDGAERFLGAVTPASLLGALLRHERELLDRSRSLRRSLERENRRLEFWSRQLEGFNEAFRRLLGVFAGRCEPTALLQGGIEALASILRVRYAAVGILDREGKLVDFAYTGISPAQVEAIGTQPQGKGLLGVVIEEDRPLHLADISQDPRAAGFPEGHPPMKTLLAVPITHDGEVYGRIYVCDKTSGEPFSKDDEVVATSFARMLALAQSTAHEVAKRRQAEKEVGMLARFPEANPYPILRVTVDGTIMYANQSSFSLLERWGCSIGQRLPGEFHRPVRDACTANRGESLEARVGDRTFAFVATPADGEQAFLYGRDITERMALEERLRQSQKMEAIGRLAGGVAHDFNNILTVISGYSQLVLDTIDEESPLRRDVEGIRKAAERAAALTRQLLAFSRRQVLQREVLDLNIVVREIETMIRQLIGESIDLTIRPDTELGRVEADRTQVEQVVLNLAANARDAMPGGGKLTVETTNVFLDDAYAAGHVGVSRGHYVMLAVSDTGCGMDRRTRAHVFDPFFTTKEVGKGTGLGLSSAYGIVKHSGGNIWIYSEPGRGTTVKIYLPRVDKPMKTRVPATESRERAPASATVLLVEDEPDVRELARRGLERVGYHVLEARNASEALDISERRRGPIQLMVTDVVMPQMNGPELAKILARSRPEMSLLYISGYPGTAVVQHGLMGKDARFLQKPFTPDSLARKVFEVLNDPEEPA